MIDLMFVTCIFKYKRKRFYNITFHFDIVFS